MIILAVYISCKPEVADEAWKFLSSFVPRAHSEEGCIQYELFKVEGKSSDFYFFEKWKDRATFDLHSAQDYLLEFKSRYSELLAAPNRVIFLS